MTRSPPPEAEQVPDPGDLYPGWDQPVAVQRPLSEFQHALVLSVFPSGAQVLDARFHRETWLPSPVRVQVALPDGSEHTVFVRTDVYIGGVETEARLLPVLAKLGLPVPTVLAGPVYDLGAPMNSPITVLSALPGTDLLSWSFAASPDELEHGMELVLAGIRRLHALTEPLRRESVTATLPQRTLLDELQDVLRRGGPWFHEPLFADAVQALLSITAAIRPPLAFSNGDYNPGNFLFNGQHLSGWIDFAWARFEDPHVGVTKYWIYDWAPWHHAGFIERYLAEQQLSMADFAIRLGVRCLWTLQREVSLRNGGEHQERYRTRVLALLRRAMGEVSGPR